MLIMMMHIMVTLIFVCLLFLNIQSNDDVSPKGALNVRDIHQMSKLGGFTIAPDKSQDKSYVAFQVVKWEMADDSSSSRIDGILLSTGESFAITPKMTGRFDTSPAISPDSKSVAFLRNGCEIFIHNIPNGNEYKLTDLPPNLEIDNLVWSPNGTFLLATIQVYEDCPDLACTSSRNTARADYGPNTYYIHSRKFIRHWNIWNIEGYNSHIFVFPVTKSYSTGTWSSSTPIDIMSGTNMNSPVPPFGGMEQIAISPSDDAITFTGNIQQPTVPFRTDWEVYEATLSSKTLRKLSTASGISRAQNPAYSPSNTEIIYTTMTQPGYEGGKLHLVARNRSTGQEKPIAASWDRSVEGITYLPSESYPETYKNFVIVEAEEDGVGKVFVIRRADAKVFPIIQEGSSGNIIFGADQMMYFSRSSLNSPSELWRLRLTFSDSQEPVVDSLVQVSAYNTAVLKKFQLAKSEKFYFSSKTGEEVMGWIMYPYNYTAGQNVKFPVLNLIHGGPEGEWNDGWSYRWNPQLFASAGYAVVMINFHGSIGWGMKFQEGVIDHWGDVYDWDIKTGMEYVGSKYPWVDLGRAAAAGASFGGFMINWMLGQKDTEEKYRCLVVHDGLFDLEAMYYSTDETFSIEYQMGQTPPYQDETYYKKWNPRNLVENWNTPTMIIHGGKDFRIPIAEGISMFTALQRKGVPSKMLVFPEECHWVQRQKNSIKWYDSVIEWLDKWTEL